MKPGEAKAVELINKMIIHQCFTGGENGGKHATRRAVQSAIVLAEEMISYLGVDGGQYWKCVKRELLKYISNEKLEDDRH